MREDEIGLCLDGSGGHSWASRLGVVGPCGLSE